MWKKKRYDIHIRLTPEDLEGFMNMFYILYEMRYIFKDSVLDNFKKFEELQWKIHSKAVEINRK